MTLLAVFVLFCLPSVLLLAWCLLIDWRAGRREARLGGPTVYLDVGAKPIGGFGDVVYSDREGES